MKRVCIIFISLFLGIVMVFGIAGCDAGTSELQGKIDDLQSKLEEMNSRLEAMEGEISERNDTIEDLNTQLKQRDEKIEQLEKELAEKSPESAGTFYTVQEAYDNGWLTQEDVMSIAYYHNGGRTHNEEIMSENYEPTPKTPHVLSDETQLKIKNTAIKEFRVKFPNSIFAEDAKADDFTIKEYNGTYGDCIAIMTEDVYTGYWGVIVTQCVAGVNLYYYDSNEIKIWRDTKNQ